jgi:hypothetical protein
VYKRQFKGWQIKKDQLLAQSVKGVDSQKAYTHINTYSIGVEREKVKAYGQSGLA